MLSKTARFYSRFAPQLTRSIPQLTRSVPIVSRLGAFERFFSSEGSSSTPGRETGTVKWFDASKGYGFITRDSGSDLFVHFTSISGDGYRALEEGQKVDFSVADGAKGPVAQDVLMKDGSAPRPRTTGGPGGFNRGGGGRPGFGGQRYGGPRETRGVEPRGEPRENRGEQNE